jgi:anti-anti-sigma factor
MTIPEFQHLRVSMVKDVANVVIWTKEFHGPYVAHELGAELGLVIPQDWAARMLVDFGRVTFLSSSGFATLFKLVSQAKDTGREVRFCTMSPVIRLGAEIVGLDKLVEIHESEASAMRAFAKAASEGPKPSSEEA